MLFKQLLVLLVQCKPTTYNRTFKKKKGKKQNTKVLRCHNIFEMGKAKACFLFLPLSVQCKVQGRTTTLGQGWM